MLCAGVRASAVPANKGFATLNLLKANVCIPEVFHHIIIRPRKLRGAQFWHITVCNTNSSALISAPWRVVSGWCGTCQSGPSMGLRAPQDFWVFYVFHLTEQQPTRVACRGSEPVPASVRYVECLAHCLQQLAPSIAKHRQVWEIASYATRLVFFLQRLVLEDDYDAAILRM